MAAGLKHQNRENRTALISFLFVLSGVLGLVYQIVWFKYLSSFLGNTTYAQSIVLATFMAGLAIGATVWGKRSDASSSPLALYGWLEISIGLFCAIFPFLLSLVHDGFVSALLSLGWTGESSGVLLFKIIVSALMLLPPTILMGGTLPILVRAVTDKLDHAGRYIAILYALNSFGAVVGSMLGGFFFIRLIGLQWTILVSAGLSVMIGIVALGLSKMYPNVQLMKEQGTARSYSAREGSVATIVAGLSGCAAMMLEVTWVRMLLPILGSSTYSFTIMLISFISGITLGGLYIAGRIDRARNLLVWLYRAQIAIVISLAISLLFYERLPFFLWHVSSILARNETSYPIFLLVQFVICFLWMVIPTFFFGISLPMAIRIAARSQNKLGASVGSVYTVNTIGTVIGSLVAGFLLIPLVGLSTTIYAAMAVLSLSALMAGRASATTGAWKSTGIVLAAHTGTMLLVLFVSTDVRIPSLSGVFRLINSNNTIPGSYDEFIRRYVPRNVEFYEEGVSATVSVISTESSAGTDRILLINGKADASTSQDLPTQMLLGHIPALLHEDPNTALIIGYGSGVTAGGLLKHPLDRIDCVEISPEVVAASPFFHGVNGDPFSDERFHLSIDDAASFIEVSPRQYDLIVSEPSNPWIAGIGSLYTTEFFERCKKKMTPKGIMSQWFHLYEIDDETFQLVVRTFSEVFPYVTLWESMTSDVILIGSEHPVEIDQSLLATRMSGPGVASDFRTIGIEDPMTLLSLQVMSNRNIRHYSGDGPLNTEDHPRLEYLAPRAFFVNRGVSHLDDFDERLMHPSPDTYLMRRVSDYPLTDDEKRTVGLFHAKPNRGHPYLGFYLLSDYQSRHREDALVLRTLIDVSGFIQKQSEKLRYLGELSVLNATDPYIHMEYGWAIFENDLRIGSMLDGVATDDAEKHLRIAIRLVDDSVDTFRARLADLYYNTGRFALAMDQYRRALEVRESFFADPYIPQDALLTRLAQCLYNVDERPRALGYALQALNLDPLNKDARLLIEKLMDEGTGPIKDSTQH
jgi:spermidine synthase